MSSRAQPSIKSEKHGLISKSNKETFIWVAITGAVVAASLVILQFLVREAIFNNKVLSAKSVANDTLIQNIETAETLKANVNALLSNDGLASVKRDDANKDASNLSIILDALPVNGDATDFADSMQKVVLPPSQVTISQLSTSSLNSAELGAEQSAEGLEQVSVTDPLEAPFQTSVSGNYDQIKQALVDMARVIRPINPKRISILGSDSTLIVEVDGVTYYMPSRTLSIQKETLKQ